MLISYQNKYLADWFIGNHCANSRDNLLSLIYQSIKGSTLGAKHMSVESGRFNIFLTEIITAPTFSFEIRYFLVHPIYTMGLYNHVFLVNILVLSYRIKDKRFFTVKLFNR